MQTLIYCAYNKIIRTQLRSSQKRAQHRRAWFVVRSSGRFRFRISPVLARHQKALFRDAHGCAWFARWQSAFAGVCRNERRYPGHQFSQGEGLFNQFFHGRIDFDEFLCVVLRLLKTLPLGNEVRDAAIVRVIFRIDVSGHRYI